MTYDAFFVEYGFDLRIEVYRMLVEEKHPGKNSNEKDRTGRDDKQSSGHTYKLTEFYQRLIVSKIKNVETAVLYANVTHKNNWSRDAQEREIELALMRKITDFMLELLCKALHNSSYVYRFIKYGHSAFRLLTGLTLAALNACTATVIHATPSMLAPVTANTHPDNWIR